jgi:hypothetical protein
MNAHGLDGRCSAYRPGWRCSGPAVWLRSDLSPLWRVCDKCKKRAAAVVPFAEWVPLVLWQVGEQYNSDGAFVGWRVFRDNGGQIEVKATLGYRSGAEAWPNFMAAEDLAIGLNCLTAIP